MFDWLRRRLTRALTPSTGPTPSPYGRPYLVASEEEIEAQCFGSEDLTHKWKRTLHDRAHAKARALAAKVHRMPRSPYVPVGATDRPPLRVVRPDEVHERDDSDLTPFVLSLLTNELTHRVDEAPTYDADPEPYAGGGGRSGGAGASDYWGDDSSTTSSFDVMANVDTTSSMFDMTDDVSAD